MKTLFLRWLHALALSVQGIVGVATFGIWLPSFISCRTMHLLLTHAAAISKETWPNEQKESSLEDLLEAEPVEETYLKGM